MSLEQNIKGLFRMYSGTEGALHLALLYSSNLATTIRKGIYIHFINAVNKFLEKDSTIKKNYKRTMFRPFNGHFQVQCLRCPFIYNCECI